MKDMKLGFSYTKNSTKFAVWSPTALDVKVIIYKDSCLQENRTFPLHKDDDCVWSNSIDGNFNGNYYLYEITHNVNGENKIYKVNDPYATGSNADSKAGLIYDRNKTNPLGWRNDNYVKLKNNVDSVIYEMHIRDFSIDASSGARADYRGKYLALTQKHTKSPKGLSTGIKYLKDLGITHVHLLPTYDFGSVNENSIETEYNWGYDPVLYNNLEGVYATNPDGICRQKEYKKMVKSLHDNGIGVIIDLVFNHTYEAAEGKYSIFDKIVPGYYYRMNEDGTFSNGSGCGNELATERPMVRKFILNSVEYWMKEYHIDGLRFDLMGVIDVRTMLEVYKTAKAINPNAIVYGEGWSGGQCLLDDSLRAVKGNVKGSGIALFNDEMRNDIKGDNDGAGKGFIQNADVEGGIRRLQQEILGQSSFVSGPNESINYVSSHDNLCLWDKVKLSCPDASEKDRKKINNLANTIVLLSQGIPFIQGGSEFARSKNGNHNSYNSLNDNDFDWNDRDKNRDMVWYYSKLIELRKKHPAFRMTDVNIINQNIKFLDSPRGTIVYQINDNANGDKWKEILVVFNGTDKELSLKLDGEWEMVLANYNFSKSKMNRKQRLYDNIIIDAYSPAILHR